MKNKRKPLRARPRLGAKVSAKQLVKHAYITYPDVMKKLSKKD